MHIGYCSTGVGRWFVFLFVFFLGGGGNNNDTHMQVQVIFHSGLGFPKFQLDQKSTGEMPPSPPASRRIFASGKQIKSSKCKAL